jgi:hypothetical protein
MYYDVLCSLANHGEIFDSVAFKYSMAWRSVCLLDSIWVHRCLVELLLQTILVNPLVQQVDEVWRLLYRRKRIELDAHRPCVPVRYFNLSDFALIFGAKVESVMI